MSSSASRRKLILNLNQGQWARTPLALWDEDTLKDTFYFQQTGRQGSCRIKGKILFEQFFCVN